MADPTQPVSEAQPDDEPDDEPDEDEDEDEAPGFEERVEKVLEKVLPKFLKSSTPREPRKRPTYRDEEDTMAEKVAGKVKELIQAEKEGGEHHPEPGEESAAPEPVPGQPRKRRVESILGW